MKERRDEERGRADDRRDGADPCEAPSRAYDPSDFIDRSSQSRIVEW